MCGRSRYRFVFRGSESGPWIRTKFILIQEAPFMFHLKLKNIFNDSISKVCSNIDEFVYQPGKDYSRVRKLSSNQVISFLISQGAS